MGITKFFPWLVDTHQTILKEAYKLLSADPAMQRFNGMFIFSGQQRVGIENILAYEGVYGNPVTLASYGPGPDADGSTFYSAHWYNPLTGQGQAPQAAFEQYQAFINALMGFGMVDEHAIRGIAWSAHFVADMFVPYHVVGIPLSDTIARLNNRNFILGEKETGPLFLYSPVPPSPDQEGILRFPQEVIRRWWRKGWGVDNEYSNAFTVFWENRMSAGENVQENPIDWFDPWYWNGLVSSDLQSSHATYEANAQRLWAQGDGYQKSFDKPDSYDPLWRNAPPDYSHQTRAWEAQSWQVQDFASKIALRTRQNIETYWKFPGLGIQGAIEAVYTLWRSAFSALETGTRVEPDPERTDAYFIIADVRNFTYEPCQNVQVTLTIQKGDNIVFQNSQALAQPLDFRNPQMVTWHVQLDMDLNEVWAFLSEAKGVFVRTPDLQYAHDIIYYQPNELEEDVEEDYGLTQSITIDGFNFAQGDRSFADQVVGFQAGEGTTDQYSNPGNALGRPNFDEGQPGSHTALGYKGVLVVGFSSVWIVDGEGPDLYVFEIGGMVEPFQVEISSDGRSWIDLGIVRGQPCTLDIAGRGAPGQGYNLVRITDAGSRMSGSPFAGADIDAVGAINAVKR